MITIRGRLVWILAGSAGGIWLAVILLAWKT